MSDKTSDKRLLPCPFCGVELELEEKGEFYIHPSGNCFMNLNAVKNAETRIKAWNTRKPMDRIVERLEELKAEALREYKEFLDGENYRQSLLLDKVIKTVKEEGGV